MHHTEKKTANRLPENESRKKAISIVTTREITLLLSPDILKNAIRIINSNTGIIARTRFITIVFKLKKRYP